MTFLLDFLKPGDCFVDVGANVGIYTLLAASVPCVHVHTFEPSSFAYGRLRENIALNGLDDRIHSTRAAVGETSGETRITVGLDTVNRLLDGGDGHVSETAPLVTLDDVMTRASVLASVALVKIDVEGLECAVLAGARTLIETVKPAFIIEANDPAGIGDQLALFGYEPFVYDPDTRTLRTTVWDDKHKKNILALADTDGVVSRLAT